MKTFTLNLFKKSFRQLTMISFIPILLLLVGDLHAQTVTINTPSASTTTITAGGTVSFSADRTTSSWNGGNSNFTFTWNSSPSTGVSFSPASSSGNNLTSASTTATFNTAGTYTITCTANENGGGETHTSSSKTVIVNAASAIVNPPAAPAPASCNASNCTVATTTCPAGQFSANFQGGTYSSGNSSNHLGQGAVWNFLNVANVAGQQINATVTVDTVYQAVLVKLDDDGALDENGNATLSDLLAPNISPDQTLNTTDRRGYVQFTITFYNHVVSPASDFTVPASLLGINYSHYDIDGGADNSTNGYQFRETGLVESIPQLLTVSANANTELVAYNYSTGTKSWKGFAGSTCNRNNTSRCAEVVASFKYNSVNSAISSVSVRMGYDYHKTGNSTGGYNQQPTRLYASKFGCFNFPQEITLPVKLLSFSGSYQNQASLLNWQVADEVNFDHYEIERSTNGYDFVKIATQQALGTQGGTRQYQLSDDLSAVSGNIFYYRLKMVDIDAKSKYSNVIMIRKDQKTINGISVVPNPVANDMATVRLSSSSAGSVDLRIIDLAGKVVLHQQNQVYQGNNSISINNLSRLQSGIYTLQIMNGETIMSSKFSLIK